MNSNINTDKRCILAYTSMYIEPDGKIRPCCVADDFKEELNFNDYDSITEIINAPQFKELRKSMEDGDPLSMCDICYKGNNQLMPHWNNMWEHKLKDPLLSDKNQNVQSLDYLDARFSNLCNFKCRTCGPDLSSSWYDDNVKLYGPLPHKKIIRPYKDEETFWKKVEPYMDGLEEIYFAGGEPLIMEEHYRILKKLDERKMYHVRLKYNTNFSIMTYKKLDVMEIWNRFESVKIGASLDGMGKRGEYLRKGQSWEQVEENRKRMFEICPDVYVFLATCLNVYNSFHVPDFHHEWIQKGWVDAVGGSLINPLFVPEELSIQVLPLEIKKRLEERYVKEQEWFDTYTDNKEKRYDKLIHFMYEKDHSHLLPKFWERTDMVDKLRKEDFISLFPELADLRIPEQV